MIGGCGGVPASDDQRSDARKCIGVLRQGAAYMNCPFRRFNALPEVIRMAVTLYSRYWLGLGSDEDLLFTYARRLGENPDRYGSALKAVVAVPDLHGLYISTGGNADNPGAGSVVKFRMYVPGQRDFKARILL